MADADEAKLHRAVLADPEADAARLALADWYDANQTRAVSSSGSGRPALRWNRRAYA